jgi:hypothetical protein
VTLRTPFIAAAATTIALVTTIASLLRSAAPHFTTIALSSLLFEAPLLATVLARAVPLGTATAANLAATVAPLLLPVVMVVAPLPTLLRVEAHRTTFPTLAPIVVWAVSLWTTVALTTTILTTLASHNLTFRGESPFPERFVVQGPHIQQDHSSEENASRN